MNILTIDEYIYLNWIRSLAPDQKAELVEQLQSGTEDAPELSATLAQSYPHDLLNIAKSIGGNQLFL